MSPSLTFPDISRPEVTLSNKACSFSLFFFLALSSSSPISLRHCSLLKGILAIFVPAFSYDVFLVFFDKFTGFLFVIAFFQDVVLSFLFEYKDQNVQIFWLLFDIMLNVLYASLEMLL